MRYSMMLKEQTVTKKAAATEDLVYARRILKDSILFRSLGDEKIHQLIALASIRYLEKQEYIVRENDPVNDFFVILRGQVKVLMLGKGGRAFTIDIYTQGNTFLSTSFFSGQPAWGSAMAMEPVALMHIPRKRFLPFIVAHPELTLVYLGYLSEGFGLAIRHIENCLTRKVDQQIIFALQRLSEKFGDVINFTADEIADFAGTAPETCIRYMNLLKGEGIVSTGRGKIIILDRDKLFNYYRK